MSIRPISTGKSSSRLRKLNLVTSMSRAKGIRTLAAMASTPIPQRWPGLRSTATLRRATRTARASTTSGTGAFIAQAPVDLSIPFSVSFTLPGRITASLSGSLDTSFDGGQDVEQVNVNGQLIAAASSADAGDVSVSSEGYTSADGIGINAVSSATAGAKVDNSVNQTNTNSLSASTTGNLGLIDQDQEALQANVNLQLLAAVSAATSGNVSVESKGDTDAGGNGIVAVSSAAAGADLDSTVTQSNTNSASANTAGDRQPLVRPRRWSRRM